MGSWMKCKICNNYFFQHQNVNFFYFLGIIFYLKKKNSHSYVNGYSKNKILKKGPVFNYSGFELSTCNMKDLFTFIHVTWQASGTIWNVRQQSLREWLAGFQPTKFNADTSPIAHRDIAWMTKLHTPHTTRLMHRAHCSLGQDAFL